MRESNDRGTRTPQGLPERARGAAGHLVLYSGWADGGDYRAQRRGQVDPAALPEWPAAGDERADRDQRRHRDRGGSEGADGPPPPDRLRLPGIQPGRAFNVLPQRHLRATGADVALVLRVRPFPAPGPRDRARLSRSRAAAAQGG